MSNVHKITSKVLFTQETKLISLTNKNTNNLIWWLLMTICLESVILFSGFCLKVAFYDHVISVILLKVD